ncbi:MAG: hypothetical protein ACYCYF_11455 [Anaerolineae bacterium]
MAKVDPDLRQEWKDAERRSFSLIVKVTGDVTARSETLADMGCQVKHAFKLNNTISVRCNGATALTLTRRPWITRVERDSIIRAFGG